MRARYVFQEKVATNHDYIVTVKDLQDWEEKHGEIPDGAVVVMNSGWARFHPNKTEVFGSQDVTDPSTFHFPGFHANAVDWMIRYRSIHVFVVDTPSTDVGQSSTTFPVHVLLGRANIPAVENIANIDGVPESGATIHVAPMKLFDGSGGPVRVYATFTTSNLSSAACPRGVSFLNAILLLLVSTLMRFGAHAPCFSNS